MKNKLIDFYQYNTDELRPSKLCIDGCGRTACKSGYCPECDPERYMTFVNSLMSNMKICIRKDCPSKGRPQPKESFNWSNKAKGIRKNYCKECSRRSDRAYYERNFK
jgi:hypothetical protein